MEKSESKKISELYNEINALEIYISVLKNVGNKECRGTNSN